MQATQIAHLLDPGPEIEVIRVAEDNLSAEFLEDILRNAFDGCLSSDRHEHRRFHGTVRRHQSAATTRFLCSFDLEGQRHGRAILKEDPRPGRKTQQFGARKVFFANFASFAVGIPEKTATAKVAKYAK